MIEAARDLWGPSADGPTLPTQAALRGNGCPGPHPDSFWVCPRREAPIFSGQLVPVLSHPHAGNSVSWFSDRASWVHCMPTACCSVTSHHCIQAVSVLCTVYLLYTSVRLPWAFSFPGRTVPAWSAFPQMWDAPDPSSYLWPFIELFPECPECDLTKCWVTLTLLLCINTSNAAQDTASYLWLQLYFSIFFCKADFFVLEGAVQKVFEWEESEVFFLQTLKRSHSSFFALLLEGVLVQDSKAGKVLRCCIVDRAVLGVYSTEKART